MSKLYRARSLLYRRQILQENIRWKALDEIYKIYKGFQKIVCILHVLRFPGSEEKPLIAARFGCLQCSEISGSAK